MHASPRLALSWTRTVAILAVAAGAGSAGALECPAMPQQASRDAEVEVRVGVRGLGNTAGAELATRTRQLTTDLMSRLPRADRVYLEQMMFAAYCSSLRDNQALSEVERERRIAAYAREMRAALQGPAATPAAAADPRDRARAELARLPVPYTLAAVFAAIERGDRRVVDLFIAAGFDMTQSDRYGQTPLPYAIARKQPAIVNALLAAGVAPTADAIGHAMELDDGLATVRLLLSRRPDPKAVGYAFEGAVGMGHLEGAKLLLQHGVDLKVHGIGAVEDAGRSGADDADVAAALDWLRGLGVPMDTPDRNGWTPLMQASAQARVHTMAALLKGGADVDRYCECPGYLEGGFTPLLMAAKKSGSDVDLTGALRLLLDAGADVRRRTRSGRTALHLVAEYSPDRLDAIELLLGRGADVNALDDDGASPLMPAARNGGLVRLLLARGARVDVQGRDGMTALIWAAVHGDVDSARQLLDAGVPIDARNARGRTAVSAAVINAAPDVLQLLIERGARTDIADANGLTPLDHANASQAASAPRMRRLLQPTPTR